MNNKEMIELVRDAIEPCEPYRDIKEGLEKVVSELERAEPVAYSGPLTLTKAEMGGGGYLYGKPFDGAVPLYRHPPSADYWQEEAKRYAGNADYWRERAEKSEKTTKAVPDGQDAARYRYLKQAGIFKAMSLDMGGNHTWTGVGRTIGRGRSVDEAIDDAILAAQQEGE